MSQSATLKLTGRFANILYRNGMIATVGSTVAAFVYYVGFYRRRLHAFQDHAKYAFCSIKPLNFIQESFYFKDLALCVVCCSCRQVLFSFRESREDIYNLIQMVCSQQMLINLFDS